MSTIRNFSLRIFTLLFQIIGLTLFYEAGEMIVHFTGIPIPGNLIGMLLLFIALCLKVLKLEWFSDGATFLIAITPLFFVPSLTGLINYGDLFLHEGLLIVSITILSGSIIFFISGWTLELLVRNGVKND